MDDEGDAVVVAPDYIRGSGGVVISGRRVVQVVVGFVLVSLVAIAVLLAIAAAQKNARIDRLHRHGVAVDVTVTSCLGLASGTGITVTGFECKGTFDVSGRRYVEVIGGSTTSLGAGDLVPAVVDPDDPSDLTAKQALSTAHSSWTRFLVPAIPAALFVLLLLLAQHLLLRRQP